MGNKRPWVSGGHGHQVLLELEWQAHVSPAMGARWELNSGPPQAWCTLVTTEAFLRPPYTYAYNSHQTATKTVN